jgi:hypothetical protein
LVAPPDVRSAGHDTRLPGRTETSDESFELRLAALP